MPNKKKKRKKPRGKAKGNGFERDIKKLILKTFAPFGITENDAFRSTLSGGHVESYGDISLSSSLAKLFPAAVECKFYKKVDLYSFVVSWNSMGKSNKFRRWWEQTLAGAVKSKGSLFPLLVFKSNNNPTYCVGYLHDILFAVTKFGHSSNNILAKKKIPHLTTFYQDGNILICFRFDALLKLLCSKEKYRRKHCGEDSTSESSYKKVAKSGLPIKQYSKSTKKLQN